MIYLKNLLEFLEHNFNNLTRNFYVLKSQFLLNDKPNTFLLTYNVLASFTVFID